MPLLSKEDMKCPISRDVSVVEYSWPTMPCVAANQFEMNSAIVQPVEISIARACGADSAFLKDIQLTLQWCCYLWNQEEAPQSWGEHRHGFRPNKCPCHWPAHQSTWSRPLSKCSQRNQQLVHHSCFMQAEAWGKPLESQHWKQGRIQDLKLGVAQRWRKWIGNLKRRGGCINIFQIRL